MSVRIVVACALGLVVAVPSLADDPCRNWDDQIDFLVLQPAREQIIKAGKDRAPIPNLDKDIGWHTGISTKDGTFGSLSSIKLLHFRDKGPASLVCQTSDETHSNITVAIDVGLTDLSVTFKNFLLRIPLLPNIGDTLTTISNSGNAVSVSVSVLTTPSKDCSVNVNYFQIHDVGTFGVEFQHGFWNSIIQGVFNMSARLTKWILTKVGVMNELETQISKTVQDLASQHGSDACEFIHNILG